MQRILELNPANRLEDSKNTLFLSVIIPAFNEAERIETTLERVQKYLSEQSYSWEVLVVDDGSSDDTAVILSRWANGEERFRVESIKHSGKGWAVKSGMLVARGHYRFMCDADLAMPIEQLGTFLDHMEEGYEVVIGSRQKMGAKRFGESRARHVMGRIFNRYVHMLTAIRFEDTQCGFKCFRGEVAEELFGLQKTKGLGFDVEILCMAVRKGMNVMELPIDWYHHSSSRVRIFSDSFLMLRDTALVKLQDLRK